MKKIKVLRVSSNTRSIHVHLLQSIKPSLDVKGEQGHLIRHYKSKHTWRTVLQITTSSPSPPLQVMGSNKSLLLYKQMLTDLKQPRRFPHSQLGVTLNSTLLHRTSLKSSSELFVWISYRFYPSESHRAPSTELGSLELCSKSLFRLFSTVYGKGKRTAHRVHLSICIKKSDATSLDLKFLYNGRLIFTPTGLMWLLYKVTPSGPSHCASHAIRPYTCLLIIIISSYLREWSWECLLLLITPI